MFGTFSLARPLFLNCRNSPRRAIPRLFRAKHNRFMIKNNIKVDFLNNIDIVKNMAGRPRLDVLVRKNPIAEHAVSKAAQGEITVDEVISQLGSERAEVVEAFQELERVGVGKFVVGRRGKLSRFEWNPGEPPSAAEVQNAAPSRKGEARMLEHSFHVRPGVVATVSLPEDITRAEIERLSLLLSAIPFE